MKELYIMIGIMGCGKSTYAKKLVEQKGAIIVSSDLIREEFYEKGIVPRDYQKEDNREIRQKYNAMIFGEFHDRIKRLLEEGKDVISDATNLTRFSRKGCLDIAKETKSKAIGIVLDVDKEECKRRVIHRENSDKNSHKIYELDKNIDQYYSSFKNPEYQATIEEGFDEIMIYHNDKLEKIEKADGEVLYFNDTTNQNLTMNQEEQGLE